MRRLYLAFGLLFVTLAIIVVLYAYYLLIRSPGAEIGIIEFVGRLIIKVPRLIINKGTD